MLYWCKKLLILLFVMRFKGASGAVNAILLLDIFLFPRKTLMFDFFIPVPAILLVRPFSKELNVERLNVCLLFLISFVCDIRGSFLSERMS